MNKTLKDPNPIHIVFSIHVQDTLNACHSSHILYSNISFYKTNLEKKAFTSFVELMWKWMLFFAFFVL